MPSERPSDTYWATDPIDELCKKLVAKVDAHHDYLRDSRLMDLWVRSHRMYQWGLEYSRIVQAGKQGEFDKIVVNHYGNIGRHIHVQTVSVQADFICRARNGDYRSRAEVELANGILDYEIDEKDGRVRHTESMEVGNLCGENYLYTRWNPQAGPILEIDDRGDMLAGSAQPGPNLPTGESSTSPMVSAGPLTGAAPAPTSRPFDDVAQLAGGVLGQGASTPGQPLYAGDTEVSAPHPVDVIRDWTRDRWFGTRWVIVRERRNRYELAAVYGTDPEKRAKILAVPPEPDERLSVRQIRLLSAARGARSDADDICLYTFWHEPTPAIPQGRIVRFLDGKTWLDEDTFAARGLETLDDVLQRVATSEIEGMPAGYSWMWDLMALCDAVNIGHSTVLTNINNFGVQNVTGPEGAEAFRDKLAEGLFYIGIRGRADGNARIEPLNLLSIGKDLVEQIAVWEALLETLSGVNSVARGNPEASLKSGAALALVQSQFLEFNRASQAAFALLWEKFCTAVLKLFQKNAKEPRLAAIVGKGARSYVKMAKGADVANIDRVKVEIASHLSRTAAGRRDLAETLLQAGLITAEEYVHVLNTGELDSRLHKANAELDFIERENEILMEGGLVRAAITDKHTLHINEHRQLTFDPAIRDDQPLMFAVLGHIQEHMAMLAQMPPVLAVVVGQPAIPPQLAPGAQPQPGAPQQGTPGAPAGEGAGMPPGAGEQIPLPVVNGATGRQASVRMPSPADAGQGIAA